MMTAFSIVFVSCLAASSAGCHGPRRCCGCGPAMHGYAGPNQANCPSKCDKYASRVYRRFDCGWPRRDPRIPGPRLVSTLPAPEMQAPAYLHPVPTYPVFGPRSEEPDGIEPELQPMTPGSPYGSPDMEEEPLPPPPNGNVPEGDIGDDVSYEEDAVDEEEEEEEEEGEPTLAAPQQRVQQAGWKPVTRQSARAAAPTRPCPSCSLSFRKASSSAK